MVRDWVDSSAIVHGTCARLPRHTIAVQMTCHPHLEVEAQWSQYQQSSWKRFKADGLVLQRHDAIAICKPRMAGKFLTTDSADCRKLS
jgi:hypothetical protein